MQSFAVSSSNPGETIYSAPARIAILAVAASKTVPAPTVNFSAGNVSFNAFITSVAPGTVYVTSIAETPPSIHALDILTASFIFSALTTATIPVSINFSNFPKKRSS